MWAVYEVNIGILAGSAPALWKLYGMVADYFARRKTPQTTEQDGNFGLVTIGELMGLNNAGSTRLHTLDGETSERGHDEEQIVFGARQHRSSSGISVVQQVHTMTPSNTDATLASRHGGDSGREK